jgi:hypothetical protein
MYSLSQPAGADPITKEYIRRHQHERTVNPQPKSYWATPIVISPITNHESRISKIIKTGKYSSLPCYVQAQIIRSVAGFKPIHSQQ